MDMEPTQDEFTKPPRRKHVRNMIIMILFLGVLFGGLFAYGVIGKYFMNQYFAHFTPPPVTISATQATSQVWKPFLPSVGQTEAAQGVDVSSEASGLIVAIYFKAGQTIEKGTPILQLDDRVEQEERKSLQAKAKLAKITFDRTKSLFDKRATSKSALDETQAKLDEANAMVEKIKVQVDHKKIKAPFTGKIGISELNVGQYITPGSKLVSLQALKPLYLRFSLPEQYLPSLYVGQRITLKVATYPNRVFHAAIEAVNATVDPRTHNILVRATVPNEDLALYPGLFAEVKVILPEQKNVVTVPLTAISYSLYGDSIFVITEKGKDKKGKPILQAKRVYVKVGEKRGNQVAIIKGIKAGDLVVTSGQLKLQDNARVVVNNKVDITTAETFKNLEP